MIAVLTRGILIVHIISGITLKQVDHLALVCVYLDFIGEGAKLGLASCASFKVKWLIKQDSIYLTFSFELPVIAPL